MRCRELDIFEILEIFEKLFGNFLIYGGNFLELFWNVFGNFLEDFSGGMFMEQFFERIFFGELFPEDFFGRNSSQKFLHLLLWSGFCQISSKNHAKVNFFYSLINMRQIFTSSWCDHKIFLFWVLWSHHARTGKTR